MDRHQELKELIKRDAIKYGKFILSSGQESDFYVDLRKVTLNPKGATLIGSIIFEMIKDRGIDAIGGMTLGADPIALATSMIAFQSGYNISAFIVRKEKKTHGTSNWMEGPIAQGQRAVVVEDVITTGSSTIKAIERIEDAGLKVEMVIALLDRMEGGKGAIEALGYKVYSVFSRETLL